ncbi:MAG: geranylgeranyl reductase family protein [Actinomyces sp.]|nr:MAG: geranylgeranyl reductase family protein [Actinomyces sp.]
MRSDVLVVGAGPAGTAAAIHLTRAGIDTLVVDRAHFPRDKTCGDGLTTLALRELEDLGLDPATVASWTPVREAVLVAPSGREHRLPLPDGPGLYAAVARRHHLDHALVELARRRGAPVVEGRALTAVAVDDAGVTVTFADGGHARCSRLVAADGMWSPVRRALVPDAADGYRGEWHAFRQYLTGVDPRAARELVVWFEPDVIPGYAWSFPVGDSTANVGFGLRRRGRLAGAEMAALWRDLLARPRLRAVLGPDATPEGPHRAWPIPARIGRLPLTAAGGRVLFVGDAAGAADPLTGEGIGQALVTGRLAAAALAGAPTDPGAAGRAYRHATRRHLLADDRMARALGPLLARRRIAEAALRLVGATAWTRRNTARWMFEDYPRALVATPRRWHRGMFTGPGAYAPL